MNLSASQTVIRDVCNAHLVHWSAVKAERKRRGRHQLARIEIARRLRALGLTTTAIGRIMDRDHSTVIKSYLRKAA